MNPLINEKWQFRRGAAVAVFLFFLFHVVWVNFSPEFMFLFYLNFCWFR